MRLFLLEAYEPTYTGLQHFTVRAETLEAAIELVQRRSEGCPYAHIDLIEESDEFAAALPAIVETGKGSYLEQPPGKFSLWAH